MNDTRTCVTGTEASVDALAARLEVPADLHEVRLDLMDCVDEQVFSLIERCHFPVIATCRPETDGGSWRDGEGDRLETLKRAAVAGAQYIDVELRVCEALGPDLRRHLSIAPSDSPGGTKLIVSAHDFEPGTERLEGLVRRLNDVGADAAKLAITVRGAGDLATLSRVTLTHGIRIVVGMGDAGTWSRVRPADFGSAWTYVSPPGGTGTAPGQMTLDRAMRLRLAEHTSLEPIALIGGLQVQGSPGPDVYNDLFALVGLPFQYLCLPATDLDEALAACSIFGVRRLSVTAPFKGAMASLCSDLDVWAQSTGAVNTAVKSGDGSWKGFNTDSAATLDVLDDVGLSGRRALILGAGSTASSVGKALASCGVTVSVAARDPDRASRSMDERGWSVVPWAQRHDKEHDVLFNCTPIGSDGKTSPWDMDRTNRADTILDVAISTDKETPIVRRARDEGCKVVPGHEFWCAQGARQMSILAEAGFSRGLLGDRLSRLSMNPGPTRDPDPIRYPALAIVGMRGAGKTTVGRMLAERLGWRFVDSDAEVESRLGMGIRELFDRGDEPAFRKAEAAVIHGCLASDRTVLATGGGCVEDDSIADSLKGAFSVWLTAPVETLASRIDDGSRPPLTSLAVEEETSRVLSRRIGRYSDCSKIEVPTHGRTPEVVCDDVEHAWRALQDHHVR